jgi:hypothetical protein
LLQIYIEVTGATSGTVLPLTRIFPCSKEILVLARNLQGNKIYKEMARKNTKIKGNCKDFCNLYQLQV